MKKQTNSKPKLLKEEYTMIKNTAKAIHTGASSMKDLPEHTVKELHNNRFTDKVEQRIHKKGGDFINYSFRLTYQRWLYVLVTLPMLALGLWAFAKMADLPITKDITDMIYLSQGFQAMIPRFFGAIGIGSGLFFSVHILCGIRFAVKYKIGMLFWDFFNAGLLGCFKAGFVWGFALIIGGNFF